MHNDLNILIATGPTGGHLFPALSVAEKFKEIHPEFDVHLLLNRKPSFLDVTASPKIKFHIIAFESFQRVFSLNFFYYLIKYAIVFWKVLHLIARLRPKLIYGFGSYGSVPAVVAGFIFRIPVFLHEQNVIPGRANQILGHLATKIATSFPGCAKGLPVRKVIYTGYPLRRSFLDQVRNPSKTSGSFFKILVFGGSQGAERLNRIFFETLSAMSSEEREKFAVTHIVGINAVDEFRERYGKLSIAFQVYGFSNQIVEFMNDADLIISRAGAGSLFEMAAMRSSVIFVPYPFAGGHQKYNAQFLSQKCAAITIEEEHLDPFFLKQTIDRFYYDSSWKKELENNITKYGTFDACEKIIEQGYQLINR